MSCSWCCCTALLDFREVRAGAVVAGGDKELATALKRPGGDIVNGIDHNTKAAIFMRGACALWCGNEHGGASRYCDQGQQEHGGKCVFHRAVKRVGGFGLNAILGSALCHAAS